MLRVQVGGSIARRDEVSGRDPSFLNRITLSVSVFISRGRWATRRGRPVVVVGYCSFEKGLVFALEHCWTGARVFAAG